MTAKTTKIENPKTPKIEEEASKKAQMEDVTNAVKDLNVTSKKQSEIMTEELRIISKKLEISEKERATLAAQAKAYTVLGKKEQATKATVDAEKKGLQTDALRLKEEKLKASIEKAVAKEEETLRLKDEENANLAELTKQQRIRRYLLQQDIDRLLKRTKENKLSDSLKEEWGYTDIKREDLLQTPQNIPGALAAEKNEMLKLQSIHLMLQTTKKATDLKADDNKGTFGSEMKSAGSAYVSNMYDKVGGFSAPLALGSMLGINPVLLKAISGFLPTNMIKTGLKHASQATIKGAWNGVKGLGGAAVRGFKKGYNSYQEKHKKPDDKPKTKGESKRTTSAVADSHEKEVLKKLTSIDNSLKKKDDKKPTEEKTEKSSFWSKILGLLTTVGGFLMRGIGSIISGIGGAIKEVVTTALGWIFGKTLLGKMANGFTSLLKGTKNLLSKGFNFAKKPLSAMKNVVTKGLSSVKTTLSKGMGAAKGAVSKTLSKAKTAVSKGFSAVKNFVAKPFSAAKGAGKAVTKTVGKVASKGAGLLKGAGKIAGKVVAPIASLAETGFVLKDMYDKGVAGSIEDMKKNWGGWDWVNPSKLAAVGGGWLGDKIGGLFEDSPEERQEKAYRFVAEKNAKENGTTVEEEYARLMTIKNKKAQGTAKKEEAKLETSAMPTEQRLEHQKLVEQQNKTEEKRQEQAEQRAIAESQKAPTQIINNYSNTIQQDRSVYPVGDSARTLLFGIQTA